MFSAISVNIQFWFERECGTVWNKKKPRRSFIWPADGDKGQTNNKLDETKEKAEEQQIIHDEILHVANTGSLYLLISLF